MCQPGFASLGLIPSPQLILVHMFRSRLESVSSRLIPPNGPEAEQLTASSMVKNVSKPEDPFQQPIGRIGRDPYVKNCRGM